MVFVEKSTLEIGIGGDLSQCLLWSLALTWMHWTRHFGTLTHLYQFYELLGNLQVQPSGTLGTFRAISLFETLVIKIST